MKKLIKIIKNASNNKKSSCLILILIFFLLIVVTLPSLAKLKNRNSIVPEASWDGQVATSYRRGTGTSSDPYVISNGAELAYFSNQLKDNDYKDTYFELGNDIILNDGIFEYNKEDGIKYIKNNTTYYVGEYANKYYLSDDRTGNNVGTVNLLNSLNNFKGNLDGKSFVIYGLYITDSSLNELGLFTNLSGTISNLCVENSVIYGGTITGGIASTATNSNLNNVEYQGYIINSNNNLLQTTQIEDKLLILTDGTSQETTPTPTFNFDGVITKITLSGEYSLSNPNESVEVAINNMPIESNNFEIELGNLLSDDLNITANGTSNNIITFSNLKYNIYYNNSIASGLIARSESTNISNSVNKGNIYGKNISGGIIGLILKSGKLEQSYNVGNIDCECLSGGLIGKIQNTNSNVEIFSSYNSGEVSSTKSSGLIGEINTTTGTVTINKSFNASNNYAIYAIKNGIVNLQSSYITNNLNVFEGSLSSSFIQTTPENLKNKLFLTQNLMYGIFVSYKDLESNSNNVWIFEDNEFPILYGDDMSQPKASINVSTYSWNDLRNNLQNIKITSNISFSIENKTNLSYIKNKSYYISNSSTPLSEEQLNSITNWTEYDGIKKIDKSGYYVIYAKIVDYRDNVTYMNSDVFALDTTGLITNINMEDVSWNKFTTNVQNLYVNSPKNIIISANSDLLEINSIQYYISQNEISEAELPNIIEWQNYVSPININQIGKYIIYAKIIDSSNSTTYINTDSIVYSGYNETIIYGRNITPTNTNYITDRSSINAKFVSTTSLLFKNGYEHKFIFSDILPIGTSLTLINNKTNKVYKHIIDTSDTSEYSFKDFREVGTALSEKNYDESSYYETEIAAEDYNLIIDFEDVKTNFDYDNLTLQLSILDENQHQKYQTLSNTIVMTNIYSNINNNPSSATIGLNTDFIEEIQYNSNSVTNININEYLEYKNINNKTVLDTTYEDKKLGLAIMIVDSQGNKLDNEFYNNIVFKVDQNEYYVESDGIIRINVPNGGYNINKTITLETKETNTSFKEGIYYIKIQGYAAYDGYYSGNMSESEINIPIRVISTNTNYEYGFNINTSGSINILSKTNTNTNKTILFNSVIDESVENPTIGISLQKKLKNTAYNQDYVAVDLKDYTTDSLIEISQNNYLMSGLEFNLNLNPSKFDYTGYKYVFTLYSNGKKLGTLEKYFVVR